MKIWTVQEKVEESQMPNINQEVPENWKVFYEGLAYDFLFVMYPLFSTDFTVTKTIDSDSDFAFMSCCANVGCCKYLKYLDFSKSGKGMENCPDAKTGKLRGFRCMLMENEADEKNPKRYNENNTPIAIDADIHKGTIIQGFVVEDLVRQMS